MWRSWCSVLAQTGCCLWRHEGFGPWQSITRWPRGEQAADKNDVFERQLRAWRKATSMHTFPQDLARCASTSYVAEQGGTNLRWSSRSLLRLPKSSWRKAKGKATSRPKAPSASVALGLGLGLLVCSVQALPELLSLEPCPGGSAATTLQANFKERPTDTHLCRVAFHVRRAMPMQAWIRDMLCQHQRGQASLAQLRSQLGEPVARSSAYKAMQAALLCDKLWLNDPTAVPTLAATTLKCAPGASEASHSATVLCPGCLSRRNAEARVRCPERRKGRHQEESRAAEALLR